MKKNETFYAFARFLSLLTVLTISTSSSIFAQSSRRTTPQTPATTTATTTTTAAEASDNQIPVDDTDKIVVETDNLQTAVLSVRSKGTDWTVSLNGQPVAYQKVAVSTVNLTIFVEADEGFSGIESFAISQELKKLKKHKSVAQQRIEVCIIGESKAKLRLDENWKITRLPDFEKAGEYFWQKPESNKALLIISKKKTGYISDLDILKRLEALNKNQSALIYYLTPKAVVSAKKKQPVAWCNLYWQDVWISSPEVGEFIKKQFDVFDDMLSGYYIFYCDLPEKSGAAAAAGDDAGAGAASHTLKIQGIETATGNRVALQTKTVRKGE